SVVPALSGRARLVGSPSRPPAPPGSGLHLTLQTSLWASVDLLQGVLKVQCYIGSAANPIPVTLTTDTSGALTGSPLVGPLGPFVPFGSIPPGPPSEGAGGTVVSNTFSLPMLTGSNLLCANPVVNAAFGLPAPHSGAYPQTTFTLGDFTVSEQ
ncbi:MAG: hypothetical protein ACR2KC_00165, partial [Acidimicrobiales bacterium]